MIILPFRPKTFLYSKLIICLYKQKCVCFYKKYKTFTIFNLNIIVKNYLINKYSKNVTKFDFKCISVFLLFCTSTFYFFFKHYFNQILSPVRQHRSSMIYINIDFMLKMFVDFVTYQ